MARYIKATECADIISEKFNISLDDLVDVFAEIPAADIVEIVRCKNCKHYKKDENGWCWLLGMYVDDNHLKDENYCSYAEEV